MFTFAFPHNYVKILQVHEPHTEGISKIPQSVNGAFAKQTVSLCTFVILCAPILLKFGYGI